MNKLTILIVEDERIVAEDIKEIVEEQGHKVCGIAKSSTLAIDLEEEHRPDLILMDIVIHGDLDGIETAKQIRMTRDVPLVFLTAYSQAGVVERAKTLNPLDYIIKPFEEAVLLRTIDQAAELITIG